MNVSLTPELKEFVAAQVKQGAHPSVSHVVHAGLRRLKEDQARRPRFAVTSAAGLEAKLLEGVHQLDRGEGMAGEAALARLHERARARTRANG